MTSYKVRISSKLAEDWKDRDLGEWLPTKGGDHIFTADQLSSLINFVRDEVDNYHEAWMYDFVAAATRQLIAFDRAVEVAA